MATSIHRRAIVLLGLTALAPAPPFALAAGPPTRQRLTLSGSTTMAPLMAEIGKRFQRTNPGVTFDIQLGGSGRGIDDARTGKADIGMVSRSLDDGTGILQSIPIARDGVAIIVHKDNPIRTLTQAQLSALYSGKIANWKGLGGRNAPVRVLAGSAEGGSSEQISHYLDIPYPRLVAERRIASNAERIAAVAGEPNALIYVSVGEAERNARSGKPVKLLAIDGISPTSPNVRTGNYPIARPLTLVTRGAPEGTSRRFIDFCISSQVTDLILAFDFVPYLD